MHPMLNTAVRAARKAGDVINRALNRIGDLNVTAKTRNDYVTEVDHAAEAAIVDIIRKAYPSHGILAEESGRQEGDDYQWIIDPLDGTTNFIHGLPQFAVSIALLHRGRIEQGVIFDPGRNELFTASRGGGAQVNDRRMRVSPARSLEGTLLGTGFPYKDQSYMDEYLATFKALAAQTAGIRRPGSAALDLAYVAAGRYDGFWEFNLSPWDIAAGVLMVQEAGGMVTDFGGGDNYLESGNVLASNGRLHTPMLKILRDNLPQEHRK
ncbi:inositol monophosphatase family protein [Thermithiobacillus plumbiphilus]|uniref:Inositol-1-monophosphatase n=1 Tax=Thermithiobacillus plumbiphilus TaxID=1729899 RepID=A0ABU9DBN8_9PROT